MFNGDEGLESRRKLLPVTTSPLGRKKKKAKMSQRPFLAKKVSEEKSSQKVEKSQRIFHQRSVPGRCDATMISP
jgi:hypothetical protein